MNPTTLLLAKAFCLAVLIAGCAGNYIPAVVELVGSAITCSNMDFPVLFRRKLALECPG